ncbi:MFS transporter [Oceanicoccus sagamiensis]|uniref:MFS transporter n=1 Tax=Oceanicoccus sagamiensis TaxID=716816 RepID=A0A1X9NDD6_9GAMM|nr:MFS transporter [Oceanicoccus sagamiensis]ARN75171.1 MFS transporter [Oceanicoccus sagamiensis]
MLNKNTQQTLSAAQDIKQLGLFASIASLSYVFWIVAGMEMVERLAYYGVKVVASLYANDPVSAGGLGVSMTDFGIILTFWAMVQSLVPVFTGGLSDRIGYKETIFISTLVKMAGYAVMAYFPSYNGFFVGAILLALGTGIFKPGIMGTLIKASNRQNSSMAWGIFYQTVNIGGFLGPIVAASLRQFSWQQVFIACIVIISCNLLLLLMYKEPDKAERLAQKAAIQRGEKKQSNLVIESISELKNPVLLAYLILFSAFWYMFNSLFDILPVFIRDWVDTTVIVSSLFGTEGTSNPVTQFLLGMDKSGLTIKPEGLMNLNAGLIMLSCFIFAALSAKLKAINSITLGTLFSSAALLIIASANAAWLIVFAIIVFSMGEMFSSPKFTEYLGNFAPTDKKAMYLGFSQLPLFFGWTLEAATAPMMYDKWAAKDTLAREFLTAYGMTAQAVANIPIGEAFDNMLIVTALSTQDATELLYSGNSVGLMWYIMSAVGFASALGFYLYGRWIVNLHHKVKHAEG